MIDINIIRENPDVVRAGMLKKKCDVAILDRLIIVDKQRRRLIADTEAKQARLNSSSDEMRKLADKNLWGGSGDLKTMGEKRETLRGELKLLSDRVTVLKAELAGVEQEYVELMRQIPNIPSADVPDGATDKENVVIRTVGKAPKFSFTPRSHEEIGLDLDLIDLERGAKVAGSKFYYLKNELVILEMAVMRFAMDVANKKGFMPMTVPNLVRADAMYGAGHFAAPEDQEDGDAYKVDRDELYLAGTAEVGLANYHAGETLAEKDLPLRYAGFSSCYRRESGTYGKETRGIYRVHQFSKIELFVYTKPEDSETEHAFLLKLSEDILGKLGLHYQVVLNCGGDLGLPQSKKWDIETWMPGMGKFGETHSCSNDTDYQARSLNIKFRRDVKKVKANVEADESEDIDVKKEVDFVHTLNNTALSSARILIALMENYQRKDGGIDVPEVLWLYTGFKKIAKK